MPRGILWDLSKQPVQNPPSFILKISPRNQLCSYAPTGYAILSVIMPHTNPLISLATATTVVFVDLL
jgi:hypothetical protein